MLVKTTDDAGSGLRASSLRFRAHRGTTYRLAVDGRSGPAGGVTLRWR
jgi:hypothetical protein